MFFEITSPRDWSRDNMHVRALIRVMPLIERDTNMCTWFLTPYSRKLVTS